MPQIQYSEKYYDDIYEYRYVRIRVRRFPARLDALIVLLHATNGVRARSRGFPRARRNPRRARRRCPARYRTRARSSIRAIHAFERVRIDRHASRRLRRRVSRARVSLHCSLASEGFRTWGVARERASRAPVQRFTCQTLRWLAAITRP